MSAKEITLWEAGGGKYVPIVYDAHIFYDRAELFIVEKIVLDDRGGDGKRIRFVGRKVSFSNNGAVMARAGAVVVGSVQIGVPTFEGSTVVAGYVAENELFRWRTSYGEVTIKNIKTIENPCGRFQSEITNCVMRYYADLLNKGVDIEDVNKEYVPGDELERKITALMLASVKEKLASIVH